MRSRAGIGRRGLGLGLAAVLAVAALVTRYSRAQEVVVRALGTGDLHVAAAAVERLADGLAQISQGRVRMAIEPDAPDTAAVAAGLRSGAATLGWVRVAELADLVPEVAALSVPFLFRDPEKALAILDVASLGPLLDDQLRKQGLEPLGYLNVGALRLAGAAAPSIPDLAGQRVMARPGPLRAVAFGALGAELMAGGMAGDTGSAPLAELRTDDLAAAGTRGPLALVEQPHAYDLVVLCAGRERFEEFAPDVREMLRGQVRETATWQRGGTAQLDAAALAGLRQQGAQVTPLPEEQLGQAHARVKAAVIEALKGADPSIVRTVLAYAD